MDVRPSSHEEVPTELPLALQDGWNHIPDRAVAVPSSDLSGKVNSPHVSYEALPDQ